MSHFKGVRYSKANIPSHVVRAAYMPLYRLNHPAETGRWVKGNRITRTFLLNGKKIGRVAG